MSATLSTVTNVRLIRWALIVPTHVLSLGWVAVALLLQRRMLFWYTWVVCVSLSHPCGASDGYDDSVCAAKAIKPLAPHKTPSPNYVQFGRPSLILHLTSILYAVHNLP